MYDDTTTTAAEAAMVRVVNWPRLATQADSDLHGMPVGVSFFLDTQGVAQWNGPSVQEVQAEGLMQLTNGNWAARPITATQMELSPVKKTVRKVKTAAKKTGKKVVAKNKKKVLTAKSKTKVKAKKSKKRSS